MLASVVRSRRLAVMAGNKHYISHFLPAEELKNFLDRNVATDWEGAIKHK